MNGMTASDKIFHLLDLEEPEKGEEKMSPENFDIELQNIRFSLDEYLECRKDMALLTTLSLFGRTFGEASENLFGETFCKKEITLLAEAQRQGQVRDDLPVEEVFRFLAALCSSYLRRIALMTEREYQEQKEMISWQKRELLAMIHAYLTGHLADPHP